MSWHLVADRRVMGSNPGSGSEPSRQSLPLGCHKRTKMNRKRFPARNKASS